MTERRIAVKPPSILFFSTGSMLLDLVLGGGWARARVCNVVGDKSAGKTLLAIEATINFVRQFPDTNNVRIRDAEAAFVGDYASLLGLPAGVEAIPNLDTVEEWHDDLLTFMQERNAKAPKFYILDSLDALSDDAEEKRDFSDGATYGTQKAKLISELFRRQIGNLAETDTTLMVISQIRENVGVTFGERYTRSGGKALDFYASQVIWIAVVGSVERTIGGVKRSIGTKVRVRVKKNKVAPPHREAVLTILYNYGVDDETSMIEWLHENKGIDALGMNQEDAKKHLLGLRERRDVDGVMNFRETLRSVTTVRWQEIERDFAPALSKYGV